MIDRLAAIQLLEKIVNFNRNQHESSFVPGGIFSGIQQQVNVNALFSHFRPPIRSTRLPVSY